MKSRPRGRKFGLPPDVVLKRLKGKDALQHQKLFAAVGNDWLWFSRRIKPLSEVAAILDDPAIESFALMRGRKAIGILELNFKEPEQCELAFFGLVPAQIGGGLGRALMAEAIARAWAKPIKRLWVHTCSFDHPSAAKFYVKSGFKPYQLMVEVHDDPRLKGFLPLSAAPHVPLLKR
jgi:N-acetylglutamate synthase-like GNAT family acetyltransferase